MSGEGTSWQVAGIFSGVLNSVLSIGSNIEIQTGKNKEYHCELDDGKKWAIISKFVVVHQNPKLVGKAFAIGKVGQDIGVDLDGPESVVFQLAEDETNAQRLWAINTSTTTDYWLGLGNTDGAGNTANPLIPLSRATNKYKPLWMDVTVTLGAYPTGMIVVTPAQLPLPPTYQLALQKLGVKDTPVQNVVSNFRIDNILSTAIYVLWTGATTAQQITWAWSADSTGVITGATVTNTSGEDVTLGAILSWDNPAQSFSVNFIASATANAGVTSASFPASVNKPLSSASIAVTQNGTDEQQRAMMKTAMDRQIAAGKVRKVKYMYM